MDRGKQTLLGEGTDDCLRHAPRLAAASAVALLLGLAACGGGTTTRKESSGQPTQDPNVKFTGDPVTVMTISTYDTDSLNAKAVLDVAQGAVVQINNDGGLGGHELKLITCNDSADPNKAADCARQAVDEGVAAMVGGFTANGDAIMPILEQAGIPWFGPPGSRRRAVQRGQLPITSGVLGLAGLGQMAAEDGCDKVASVNYDLPSAGQIAQLVDLALTTAGHDKSTLIKVPPTTTDFSTIAQETTTPTAPWSARHRRLHGHRGRRRPARQQDHVLRGPRRPHRHRVRERRGGGRGHQVLSNFPDLDDPIWDDAKKYAGDLEDEENGGFPGSTSQNTWVAYRTFLSLIKNNDDFSAAGVKATLDATTQVDTTVSLRRSASPRTSPRPG